MKLKFLTLATALTISLGARAQEAPTAPLPAQLTAPAKVFLSQNCDYENALCTTAYNLFYQGAKTVPGYTIVSTPADSGLVLVLGYLSNSNRTTVPGPTVHGFKLSGRHLSLTVVDTKTGTVLWKLTQEIEASSMDKDKNLDKSMTALIDDLKKLVAGAVPTDKK